MKRSVINNYAGIQAWTGPFPGKPPCMMPCTEGLAQAHSPPVSLYSSLDIVHFPLQALTVPNQTQFPNTHCTFPPRSEWGTFPFCFNPAILNSKCSVRHPLLPNTLLTAPTHPSPRLGELHLFSPQWPDEYVWIYCILGKSLLACIALLPSSRPLR